MPDPTKPFSPVPLPPLQGAPQSHVTDASPAAPPSQLMAVSVHGPYEDLAIEGLRVLEKMIDGQPPEVRKELWMRFMDWSAPFHQTSVEIAKAINDAIVEFLKGGFGK